MDLILTQPRGFCAGVVRAIDVVEQALARHGAPVYVLHEIVHNPHVLEDLRAKGAIFVEDLEQVPAGAVTIFSAHGVARAVVGRAGQRKLRVIDATCPLVTKVHRQARRFHRQGYEVIIVGHAGHVEVEGTCGQLEDRVHVVGTVAEVARLDIDRSARVAYVTQTTLSLDDTRDVITALERRFPGIEGPGVDNICYATQNRQTAVRNLAPRLDLLLVVGARNSSNSNRLREVGAQGGVRSHLIEHAGQLDPAWLEGISAIGVTAGASTPERLVQEVVSRLREYGVSHVEEMDGEREDIVFPLPAPVRPAVPGASLPGKV